MPRFQNQVSRQTKIVKPRDREIRKPPVAAMTSTQYQNAQCAKPPTAIKTLDRPIDTAWMSQPGFTPMIRKMPPESQFVRC
ncbi:TPA: hypothetical protein DEP94_00910 [Candidatus Nomurabacteria bacterium]|nr:hypothetical protein [Candidatus Nomurabacteria bacterium]